MAIAKFSFDRMWTNPEGEHGFSTYEEDETRVRADMQELHNETRDYINNTLLASVDDAIDESKNYVDDTVDELTDSVDTKLDDMKKYVDKAVEGGGYFPEDSILEVFDKY